MVNRKRVSISEKNIPNPATYDSLFKNEGSTQRIENADKKEERESSKDVQKKLHRFEDIKAYYLNFDRKKQISTYMPRALQIKLKSKAAAENMTLSQFLLNLILSQGLTDQEIKEAYQYEIDHPEINK